MSTELEARDSRPPTPVSLSESLTRQFYDWERRGRGWQVWDGPVELEPPFRPFSYRLAQFGQPIDDGRRDTFLSRWTQKLLGHADGPCANVETPAINEVPPRYVHKVEPIVEFQVTLAPSQAVSKTLAEHFLLNAAYCRYPIAFEIVGTRDTIVVQFTCMDADAEQVGGQLRAHFPDAVVKVEYDYLLRNWIGYTGGDSVIVVFGLSNEFMRPLRTFRNLECDPLIGIVGALDALDSGEIGVIQVLFQSVRTPWAESIVHAVTDGHGRSIFVDAPEMLALAREKIMHPLHAVVLRVAACSQHRGRAWDIVRGLGSGLSQYNNPSSNELIPLDNDGYPNRLHEEDLLRRQSHRSGMLLNTDELVGLTHLPAPSVRSERLIRTVLRSKAAPDIVARGEILLGHNTHNGVTAPVMLQAEHRSKHIYVVGSSGTGKSTFLLNLLTQDIAGGRGLALLDPHGDLVDDVLARIPEHRYKDVILFDPADGEFPIGFNILSAHSELEKTLIASDMVSVFRRLSTSWGDQMTTVFSNAILALLESDRGGTLSDLRRFLVEKEFRNEYLKSVRDRDVVYYWKKEFPLLSGRPQAPILTRLDAFLRPKSIRYMVAQQENRLDFTDIMNGGKIFLARLSQGAIGEENAYLLGTMLVSKFHQLALSRQDTTEAKRRPFYLYIDEFQNFVTPSMSSILTGARKYRLGLVIAHQELRQLEKRDSEVASAVLANPFTRVCFRVGESDARKLAEGFRYFEPQDILDLGTGEAICRVGRVDCDFNLHVPLSRKIEESQAADCRDRIRACSRQSYGTARHEVEAFLDERWQSWNPLDPDRTKDKVTDVPPVNLSRPALSGLVANAGTHIPIDEPVPTRVRGSVLAVPALMGKGGPEHRYLQQRLKRWAEGMGYRATIEKPLDDRASIDVVLEKGGVAIACEIAVTTSPDHEVANIRKCLGASYTTVVAVSKDAGKLAEIRRRLEETLSAEELPNVQCLSPEALFAYIEALEAKSAEREHRVRGYDVKVKYGVASAQEKQVKKRAVSQVILGALSRKK